MKQIISLLIVLAAMRSITFSQEAKPPSGFTSKTIVVEGAPIHFVKGGKGEPLVLLHGFAQNWFMWNRLLPELAKHFTVIAPDLPGLGSSGPLKTPYTKKTMARHIHSLVEKIGYKKIKLVGHDIGLMVAYSYAKLYDGEVTKLALLDALLPGIEPAWTEVRSAAWWFGFFHWAPSGSIVSGKEKDFLTGFWPVVGYVKNPFTKQESDEFIRAYALNHSIKESFKWFAAFPTDAIDNIEFAKDKLKMPLLAMAGEHASNFLPEHCKLVAEDVTGIIIPGAGHWIVQENEAAVRKGLLEFLLK